MSEDIPEGYTESISGEQFLQEMMHPGSVPHGKPVYDTCVVTKRDPIPGEDLLEQTVRVSFDFKIKVNDSKIRNSGSNAEMKAYDMALLKSFLTADKDKLLMLMVDKVGSELGWHPDAFMEDFLSQVSTEPHQLFKPAIDALTGNEKQFWQEIEQNTEIIEHTSCLSLATEDIFECFKATFISSSYEVVDTHE